MGFLDGVLGTGSNESDEVDEEKIIEITPVGKMAVENHTINGLEYEILDAMKSGKPTTVEQLCHALNERRRLVYPTCRRLYGRKLIRTLG